MKKSLMLCAILFASCSSTLTEGISSTSSTVKNIVAMDKKAASAVAFETIEFADKNDKIGANLLKKRDFKEAYEYFYDKCDASGDASMCALSGYAYTKCDLLELGCEAKIFSKNDEASRLNAALFAKEGKAISAGKLYAANLKNVDINQASKAYGELACKMHPSYCE